MTSTARKVAAGSAWMFGAQIAAMVLQIGYAAVTARLVGPQAFGLYAAALAASGFISVVANAGLGQSVMRTRDLPEGDVRKINSLALGIGAIGALVLYAGATLWSRVWIGDSGAVTATEWLALSALVTPLLGVLMAVARRRNLFRVLALTQLGCNFIGMLIGVLFVIQYRTASALVANLVITQYLMVFLLAAVIGKASLPASINASVFHHLGFSGKVTVSNILSYFQANSLKWSVSSSLGASTLGMWNRAEVVSTVPFQALQNSLVQAIYPEFRHHPAGSTQARELWSDLLVFLGWITFPVSVAAAFLVPFVVPVVLGDGWEQVSDIIPFFCIAAGLQSVNTLLASALESAAKFRIIYSTQLISVGAQIAIVVLVVSEKAETWALAGLIAIPALRHGAQLIWGHRRKLVDARAVAMGYASTLVVLLPLWWYDVIIGELMQSDGSEQALLGVALVIETIALGALLRFLYQKTPVFIIASRYGLRR